MGHRIDSRKAGAGLLALAAAAWPNVMCALSTLTASPLERAMRAAICGDTPISEMYWGCPLCVTGAATLALAALLMWASPSPRAARAAFTGLVR